ncbi:hypothetical protein SDC9_202762 [bioreactor metagenome]|uniref:Uncharacterized protein n=1 Tax=bioreactor metagenome TaxID=1076179 RepID=A0A645J6I4_9ZZZZ
MTNMDKKNNIDGINAAVAIVEYGIPVISAIRNAVAPITGGIIWPPVDATASTAAAK